ncbi:hypothetical protein JOQ06_014645 [Pogonophryne albipinna]|uniref:Uncharacterized protein n=1 Tax=Pogonophryne albipinna TaxID=1090488 RepID=A0AAD6ALH5_9TELE|nr:hypothetical protein JOQ06_014645 [Pogonophryne albipinna]
MVLAAQQKASLLQQTWIREALTLRANIVDSPHDQSPPLFVEKGPLRSVTRVQGEKRRAGDRRVRTRQQSILVRCLLTVTAPVNSERTAELSSSHPEVLLLWHVRNVTCSPIKRVEQLSLVFTYMSQLTPGSRKQSCSRAGWSVSERQQCLEVCSCGCSTLAAHHHVASSSQAAIGWHLWGSVKKSFSDRTQEPRGVAANWEKDNVGGTRGALGALKRWHHLGWERGGAGK